MMRVFSYFVEPSLYTVDLINNIHLKLGVDYAVINSYSEVESDTGLHKASFLQNLSFWHRVRFVYKTWRDYNLIIVNGYNNYVFLILYFLNVISCKKRYIAIESDTQLKIPFNIFISSFIDM